MLQYRVLQIFHIVEVLPFGVGKYVVDGLLHGLEQWRKSALKIGKAHGEIRMLCQVAAKFGDVAAIGIIKPVHQSGNTRPSLRRAVITCLPLGKLACLRIFLTLPLGLR